jgi:hypothetical protein
VDGDLAAEFARGGVLAAGLGRRDHVHTTESRTFQNLQEFLDDSKEIHKNLPACSGRFSAT